MVWRMVRARCGMIVSAELFPARFGMRSVMDSRMGLASAALNGMSSLWCRFSAQASAQRTSVFRSSAGPSE